MRSARAILATLLVGAGVVGVTAGPAGAAPTQRWSVDIPGGAIRESSPLAVDLDGGDDDIVVGAHNSRVYAVHGGDGSVVGGWPRTTTNAVNSSPAAANVEGDARPEVFVGAGIGSRVLAGRLRRRHLLLQCPLPRLHRRHKPHPPIAPEKRSV